MDQAYVQDGLTWVTVVPQYNIIALYASDVGERIAAELWVKGNNFAPVASPHQVCVIYYHTRELPVFFRAVPLRISIPCVPVGVQECALPCTTTEPP
jgi:hypothetical protein